MMDKEAKRAYQREYMKRRRNKTPEVAPQSTNSEAGTVRPSPVRPEMLDPDVRPTDYGLEGCQCLHCQSGRVNHSKNTINHGPVKHHNALGPREVNRVALPGDVDYKGRVPQPRLKVRWEG